MIGIPKLMKQKLNFKISMMMHGHYDDYVIHGYHDACDWNDSCDFDDYALHHYYSN